MEGLKITDAALGAYLERVVPGFRGLTHVEKFGTGQSNPTYKLVAQDGVYVLRTKPPGRLLKSAHRVDREYRVMKALAGTAVPVPEVLHFADDDASPFGRSFLVMRFLEGRIFWDPALPDLEAARRGGVYDAMCDTLVALHSVEVASLGLSDFGRPGNYFQRQTKRWTEQYHASALRPDADVIFLIGWLARHMPEDDGQVALVHGDYRIDNMIFACDREDVIGLLDWELSTLGHPLADLAYQCMQWRLPNRDGMKGLAGVERGETGLPTEDDYVARYCERRGIGAISNWPFYLVFSFFRLAAILEGVVRRAHDGNASNPETARRYSRVVPFLARTAREIAQGA
ncbi:MAG: phosphotransferase [Pseudomonadota bacterium]